MELAGIVLAVILVGIAVVLLGPFLAAKGRARKTGDHREARSIGRAVIALLILGVVLGILAGIRYIATHYPN